MKQKNYQFAEQWSSEIEAGGYTQMPNFLIKHQKELGISNGEMTILTDLLMYKWTADNPYPAVSSLSKISGMSSESIRRHLRSLEKKQLIKRVFRLSNTNEYNLDPLKDKLQAIAQKSIPPVQKRIPPSTEPTSPPYSIPHTKEEATNNTFIRRTSSNGKPVSLSEMFKEVQRKKNERNK